MSPAPGRGLGRRSVCGLLDVRLRSRSRRVADGVRRLTGGFPLTNHVYLVAEDDGVALFDAGAREMAPLILDALGGAKLAWIMLGHSVSDVIYTIDADRGHKCEPRIPHPAYNFDAVQARDSVRSLANLNLREVWAGHADPVVRDVRRRRLAAAAAEDEST